VRCGAIWEHFEEFFRHNWSQSGHNRPIFGEFGIGNLGKKKSIFGLTLAFGENRDPPGAKIDVTSSVGLLKARLQSRSIGWWGTCSCRERPLSRRESMRLDSMLAVRSPPPRERAGPRRIDASAFIHMR